MSRLFKSRFFVVVTGLCLLSLFAVVFAQSRITGNTVTGQFGAMVADFFDEGYSETSHYLLGDNGRHYVVEFDPGVEPPSPGSQVTLSGRIKGDTIYVNRVVRSMAHAALTNSPIGEQRFVIALIRFQNDAAGNENATVEQVQDKMFDPDYSVSDWFMEASYGKTWATGDVFGWFTLPQDRGCNPSSWRSAVIPMLDAVTNLTQYNRLYILVPQAGGCTWGGLGTLGASNYNTNDGVWNVTTSWTRSEYFNEDLTLPRGAVFVTAHEVGHNMAQNHGNSLTFTDNRAMGPFGCDGCEGTDTAYADQHSSMGGAWRPGHHNAEHKRNLGWFNNGNILEVTRSGVYEIAPFENDTNEPIALRILRGFVTSTGRNEYLFGEWRQPIGYDTELNHMSNAAYNGLFVHWDYRTNTYGFNLDMTPGDSEMRNAPLPIGQTWNDQYTKLSLQTLGIVNNKLRVQVTIGQPLLPTGLQILRGVHISGGLSQSNTSDNQYLAVKAGLVLSPAEPPVWIEYTTTHVGADPGAFRFEFEGKTNTVLNQRIQLFNYTNNVWDTVSNIDSSTSDAWVEANVWSNTGRYIHDTTGEMKARVQFHVDRLLLVWPFTASIDQAVWKILR